MKYLEGFASSVQETVQVVEDQGVALNDLASIDELMPVVTDLLRAGRADLVLPFYEKALPMLEQVVSFAYANLVQFDTYLHAEQPVQQGQEE